MYVTLIHEPVYLATSLQNVAILVGRHIGFYVNAFAAAFYCLDRSCETESMPSHQFQIRSLQKLIFKQQRPICPEQHIRVSLHVPSPNCACLFECQHCTLYRTAATDKRAEGSCENCLALDEQKGRQEEIFDSSARYLQRHRDQTVTCTCSTICVVQFDSWKSWQY